MANTMMQGTKGRDWANVVLALCVFFSPWVIGFAADMAKTDIARRVYNHAWKLDPIVRSLIDTDFYKLLMLQMIWKLYPDVDATFTVINRTKRVLLAEEIDEGELREQLDHARTLKALQEGDDLAGR
jgi:hypothetical protein